MRSIRLIGHSYRKVQEPTSSRPRNPFIERSGLTRKVTWTWASPTTYTTDWGASTIASRNVGEWVIWQGGVLRFFRFERQFPHAELRVKWRATETKQEAYAAEGQVLLGYVRRHCELPPLNYKFNWQMFETHGWDILDEDVAPGTPPA